MDKKKNMNRKLKFRAILKLETCKIMIEDVVVYSDGQIGFPSESLEKLLPKDHSIDWDSMCIRFSDDDHFDNVLSILTGEEWIWLDDLDSFEVMQYTGLTDKNGKEIYEGDILSKSYGSSVPVFAVAWHTERSMFIQHDGYNEPLHLIAPIHIEVIGNIYENPELINAN